jgi:hypothetical protein
LIQVLSSLCLLLIALLGGSALGFAREPFPEALVLVGLRAGIARGAVAHVLALALGLEAGALAAGELVALVIARALAIAGLVLALGALARLVALLLLLAAARVAGALFVVPRLGT